MKLLRIALSSVAFYVTAHLAVAYAELPIREEQEDGVHYAAKYDRFGGGGAQFIGAGYNWSGIGRELNTPFNAARWGTLISSTFYVSAHHFNVYPSAEQDIVFYKGITSQNLDPLQRKASASQWKVAQPNDPDFDLHLGRLYDPVDSTISVYPIYLRSDSNAYLNQE